MNHKYDDIINMEHPTSTEHPRMSLYNRAAQFSPFAALTGFGEVIDKTGIENTKEMERVEYYDDPTC